MQVKIAVRHGALSEEHQTLISEKAEKLLHYFDRLTMIEVTVDLSNNEVKIEILATAEHKKDFVSHHTHSDVSTAMNGAVEKIRHQIQHYKEKIQDHRRDPSHGDVEGKRP